MILQPIILSGGSGTRLWPLSRVAYPKQFLALATERTLVQETLLRLTGVTEQVQSPILVCNEAHRFIVAEQLRSLGVNNSTILLEPCSRNTAPALTLAALQVRHDDANPILIAMPADHHIHDDEGFREAVRVGMGLASKDNLVTFGIVPNAPETGYGYIRCGAPVDQGPACGLASFVEKPDLETAAGYFESGEYLWNSGIFMMRASVWLRAIERYSPDILSVCAGAAQRARADGNFIHIDAKLFEACPSDSIDYAVMEKIAASCAVQTQTPFHSVVVPLDAGWSDVGSWSALCEVREQDERGNVTQGDVYLEDSNNSLMLAQHRFLAGVGVKDLIVVETADAVLVADKNQTQNVKAITSMLERSGRTEHVYHTTIHRPWGSVQSVDQGHRFQVKRITVNPGAKLSLQMHHHRAEHWVVVRGTAKVTRNGESFLLTENESTYIPVGTHHRLENPGTLALEIIEVRSGSYMGEDDIMRFEDDYDRIDERQD